MQKFYFDLFGWLSAEVIEGRETEIAPPDQPLAEGFAWNFTGYEWRPQELDPKPQALPQAPPAPRRVTRLAFLSRFTDDEAIGIDLASQGYTVPAASVRRYLSKVNAAEFIDLTDTATRTGVYALEVANLLAKGRAAEILDAPVTEAERFKGVA